MTARETPAVEEWRGAHAASATTAAKTQERAFIAEPRQSPRRPRPPPIPPTGNR